MTRTGAPDNTVTKDLILCCGGGGGPLQRAGAGDVLERPYTAGGRGDLPPGPPPLPFQCLRLTAKTLLRRLRCQEDLHFKMFGPPSAGVIGGPWEEGGGPSHPPSAPSNTSLAAGGGGGLLTSFSLLLVTACAARCADLVSTNTHVTAHESSFGVEGLNGGCMVPSSGWCTCLSLVCATTKPPPPPRRQHKDHSSSSSSADGGGGGLQCHGPCHLQRRRWEGAVN